MSELSFFYKLDSFYPIPRCQDPVKGAGRAAPLDVSQDSHPHIDPCLLPDRLPDAVPDAGQSQGIQRMIQENRYCVDIVQQLAALSAAVDEVALLVLQHHVEGCVTDAIREGGGEHHINELMMVLRKAMRR